MKDIKQIVASNLIALRKSKNWTQTDVARQLNYSDKSVSKWENGESLPDISVLCALADMYGVTLDYLTHEDAEEKLKYIKAQSDADKNNRMIIILMSVTVAFLICTLIFIYSIFIGEKIFWQIFVWGIPAACVILLFFMKRWGGSKVVKTITLSVFCWSLLTSAYLQFLNYQLWLIFILGIPLQTIIILGSKLQHKKTDIFLRNSAKKQS